MRSIGQEMVDKETLRHIAYYKALSEGMPQEILEKIKNGSLFEDDLNKILAQDFKVKDVERFEEKLKSKCVKCKQEWSDTGSAWKSEDGMTESVMSTEDDRFKLMLIRAGNNRESGPRMTRDDVFTGESSAPTFKQKLRELIENIDDLSDKAQNIKISRNEFLNCLRDLTKEKILAVKESKDIFEKRIKKLIKAQDYEVKSQEQYAIAAA